MVRDPNANHIVVDAYLKPLVDLWSTVFIETMKHIITADFIPVKDHVLKTTSKLVQVFPKQSKHLIVPTLQGTWMDLEHLSNVYQDKWILPSDEDFDEEEQVLFSAYLYSALDFIQMVSKKSMAKALFVPSLSVLVRVLLSYLGIPIITINGWNRDINQLVQDDDEDSMSHSVRIAVDQLLLGLYDVYEM